MTTNQIDDNGWINPKADPAATNKAINEILGANTSNDYPVITFPEDDLVVLPGGLDTGSAIYQTAVVRELTGEDEEALAKAMQSVNPFHFVDTLLERGTVSIGDAPVGQTKNLLKQILIGDRDALILGIRKATYGNDIEFEGWVCPNCSTETDLTLTLDEIKVQKLDRLSDVNFEVPLRKGGKAVVRLPNGADQKKVYENPKMTDKERDSVLLSQIVTEIVDKNGISHNVVVQPTLMRDMGIADRKSILKEVVLRQPGPKYDGVTFVHEDCGDEVSLLVTVGDLFLDLV